MAWIPRALILLVLTALLAGCSSRINPETGQHQTWVNLPGSDSHKYWLREKWEDCIQWNSVSYCERRHHVRRDQFPPARPQRY